MEDYLVKSIYKDGLIRAFAVKATNVIAEAQERHDTWSSSTVALGRTMLGTMLLGANQKGEDKITVRINGNGSAGEILVDADAHGNVKGYISNPFVDLKRNDNGEVIVNQAVGNEGFLTVIKDMGLREPYAGQTPLISGEIAEDFTYYLTESEQIPSAVGLSVQLDAEDRVRVAGGFMVQVMPGATEETIQFIEERLQQLRAISELLTKDGKPEDLLDAIFGEGEYKALEQLPVQFHCDCSKEKFGRGIISLGVAEIHAIIEEDHGAEVVCQFCENKYQFSEEDLVALEKEATRE
ncbi:MAG: Hsp33 family molecular chaperone HslO [Lactobacillales bacterium]|nr:Hsp33 family molecular chaperone HslO [Lactobacillales bacterium]